MKTTIIIQQSFQKLIKMAGINVKKETLQFTMKLGVMILEKADLYLDLAIMRI